MRSKHESNIEDFAFDYIKNFYMQRHAVPGVAVFMSEKAKNGENADGLFVYNKSDDEPFFLASLHTASSEKVAKLLTAYKKKAFKHSLNAITSMAALTLAFAVFLFTDQLLLTGLTGLVAVPCVYYLTFQAYKYLYQKQLASLLNVFKRLPANQQWLGISISSQTFKKNELAHWFLSSCKKRGIGVITVGKRSKVVQLSEPEHTTRRNGDYLSYYRSEIAMRKEILGDKIMRVA